MVESGFIVVENQNILEALFRDLNYFHDAFVKNVSLFTKAHIDKDGDWYGYGDSYNARLLVLSQSPEIRCLELVFINVETINMRFNYDLTPSGTVEKNKVVVSFEEEPYASNFMIVAKQLKYKKFLPNEAIGPIEQNSEMLQVWEKVSLVNDTNILYTSYDSREMAIFVQKHSAGIILDSDAIQSWLPPHERDPISNLEKKLIQAHISAYLDKHGIVHGWI